MTLNCNLLNVAAIHRRRELAKDNFRFTTMLLIEHAEYGENNQRQDQPKGDMFR
jgi:hypothetical protein